MKNIADEINKALREFTSEVEEGLEEKKKQAAKNAVKELKQKSPRDTGDYARGWRSKKVGNAYVIHNATNYQLTHLLEKGHAKRGGGRVPGIPHIRPVEMQTIEEFQKEVERMIRG